MSKVSIIIPCSAPALLPVPAIDSALAQTHPDVEIVVVVAGAPGLAQDVAARYRGHAKVRCHVIEAAGLGAVRNEALERARGDYVCLLDGGSTFAPDKVRRQAELLDADPQVGWIYCDLSAVDEKGGALSQVAPVSATKRMLSGDLFNSLLFGSYFPASTVMVRRSVLAQLQGWDAAPGLDADYDLWLRLAAAHRAVFIPEPLVVSRPALTDAGRDAPLLAARRLETLRKAARLHPDRVAQGVGDLQDAVADQFATIEWMRSGYRASRTVEAAAEAVAEQYAQLTVLWRAKLEAALVIARLDRATAARLMLEAVKSVESSRNPRVILEALLEVPQHLAALDAGRAHYLLTMAAKLAAGWGNLAARDRAIALLKTMGPVPPGRAPAASPPVGTRKDASQAA